MSENRIAEATVLILIPSMAISLFSLPAANAPRTIRAGSKACADTLHNYSTRDFLSLFQTNTDATNTQNKPCPQKANCKQVCAELQKHPHYYYQKEEYRGGQGMLQLNNCICIRKKDLRCLILRKVFSLIIIQSPFMKTEYD